MGDEIWDNDLVSEVENLLGAIKTVKPKTALFTTFTVSLSFIDAVLGARVLAGNALSRRPAMHLLELIHGRRVGVHGAMARLRLFPCGQEVIKRVAGTLGRWCDMRGRCSRRRRNQGNASNGCRRRCAPYRCRMFVEMAVANRC